ncbi:MAG TPA: VCBS repeat-containing protein [Terriglobales bacterium]
MKLTSIATPALFFLMTLGLSAASAQEFHTGATYTVGTEPQTVVVADFNNDGKPDLAIPDYTSQEISILLGNGNGTFKVLKPFSTTSGAAALAVGDFNGDGNLDIAVTEYGFGGPGVLAIYLGNGDGTFTPGASYSIGSDPYDITVADFNGDGILDLATANNGPNSISVFFGNGNGTFKSPVNYYSPSPERVLAVDLNGDGRPDLAVLAYCGGEPKVCNHGAVQVLLNTGKGKFGTPTYFPVGVGPDGIAAADLNHDGNIDLVVANNNFQAPSTVSVLFGRGDGTFEWPDSYNVGDGPAGLAVADLNHDGSLDIAVANVGSSTLSILYGDDKGKFGTAQTYTFASSSATIAVAAAQLRPNRGPDLTVVLDYANQVTVLLNKD